MILRLGAGALAAFMVFALMPSAIEARPPGGGGGGSKKGNILGEAVSPQLGPIGGATVLLFDGIAIDQIAETITDSDGNFQFRRLNAGQYSISVVSFDPPCSGNATVNVVSGQTTVAVVGMNCQ
jgi:hypothetical protein